MYLAFGIICLVSAVWARKQPFRFYNPRPAAFYVGLFWAPIYIGVGIVLPIMDAMYPYNIDWGFCVQLVIVAFYYLAYAPMLYVVIVKDSQASSQSAGRIFPLFFFSRCVVFDQQWLG